MAIINSSRYEEAWQGVTLLADARDTDQIGSDTPNGFRWIQTIITNDPLAGDPPEKLDQSKSNPPRTDPFYNNTPANVFKDDFEDICHRDLPAPKKTTEWNATLTLCAINLEKKLLVVHDIRTWGFKMSVSDASSTVGNVTVLPFVEDWSALIKHTTLVQAARQMWRFSPAKFPRVRKPLF